MTKKLSHDLDNNPAKVATDNLISSSVSNDEEHVDISRGTRKRHKMKTKLTTILSGFCTMQKTYNLKPMARHASENPFRSAFSFAMTILSTHFTLGKSLKPKIYEYSPDDANKTTDLV